MPKKRENKREKGQNSLDDESISQKMLEIFKRAMENESIMSDPGVKPKEISRRSTIREPSPNEAQQEKQMELIHKKELELKDKEIELLKRENELMKGGASVSTNTSNCPIFTFRDVEESLSKFSGDDDYLLSKWVKDIDETAVCTGWTDQQKVVYAKRLLSGTAKNSLRVAENIDTWEKLINLLQYEFPETKNSAVIHRKMAERRKQQNESYTNYLLAMRELGKNGHLEEAAVIQYSIDGIIDFEPNKAVLYGANTFEEFKAKLRYYEEIKEKSKSSHKSESVLVKSKDESKSSQSRRGPRCFNCGGVGHVGRDCRNKSKGPKCYKCQEFGHVSTNCERKSELTKKSCTVLGEPSAHASKTIKNLSLNGIEFYALVDTGSDINLMSHRKFLLTGLVSLGGEPIVFRGAGSIGLSTLGYFETILKIDGDEYKTNIHVVQDGVLPVDFILGRELINQTITVLTPESITMKKIVPEICSLAIQSGDVPIELGHVNDAAAADAIRKAVINYNPEKQQRTTNIQMHTEVVDQKPIAYKPRRLSPLEMEVVKNQIDEWLEEKVIRRSSSEYVFKIRLKLVKHV